MKKSAFTLMEVLLAMAIIGVLATAAANTLGNIGADKTKVAFKNCYNHMVQTIDSIVSDETKCPTSYFSHNTNWLDSTSHRTKTPLRLSCVTMNNNGNVTQDQSRFPYHFVQATSHIASSQVTRGYKFEAKNGSYWIVAWNPDLQNSIVSGEVNTISNADYIFVFDVNGIGVGSDCPYKLSDEKVKSSEGANCNNPDTFKFGLTYDNQILPDTQSYYNGQNLTNYMADEHLIETEF